jgi:hypothetical protein
MNAGLAAKVAAGTAIDAAGPALGAALTATSAGVWGIDAVARAVNAAVPAMVAIVRGVMPERCFKSANPDFQEAVASYGTNETYPFGRRFHECGELFRVTCPEGIALKSLSSFLLLGEGFQ